MEKSLIVVNALGIADWACREFAQGAPAWKMTLNQLRTPPLEALDLVILRETGEELLDTEELRELRISGRGVHQVLTALAEQYPDYQYYIFADITAPFIDPELFLQFQQRAEEQLAHYAYGEHYPRGVTPQVLSAEALAILRGVSSARNFPFTDEAIFDLMGLDINSYDIEMIVSRHDFRRWRLDLRIRDAYSFALAERLLRIEPKLLERAPYPLLSETIGSHPEILRILPSYLELDLSGACQLACGFCPRSLSEMTGYADSPPAPREGVLRLIQDLAMMNPGATLALSPFSEPLLSADFTFVTEEALRQGLRVVIETNGLALTEERARFLAGLDEERSIIIISPDYARAEMYHQAKGRDALAELDEKIRYLLTCRQRNIWLQIIQFENSDEEMDAFYTKWKDHEDAILPRKYNNWCGRLAGNAAVDLSPIRRAPCWHLARDLVVRADGSVYLCKQDLAGAAIGNVFQEGLRAVWDRLDSVWRDHAQLYGQDKLEIEAQDTLCARCDEWHTFNY
ncbi:MAG: spiro-SPASM protein [Spirochaetota bacterium]|jgi:spiro-SPASM protein|nr:spiro-SPASM protein [Spirochaetota bacterium]